MRRSGGYVDRNTKVMHGCKFALCEELISRGIFQVEDQGILFTQKPIDDKETLSLLLDGVLELPIKNRTLSRLIHVWSVSGFHRNVPNERIEKLLIAEYETLPCFQRLGMREGTQWIHVSKEINRFKPI